MNNKKPGGGEEKLKACYLSLKYELKASLRNIDKHTFNPFNLVMSISVAATKLRHSHYAIEYI